MYANIVHIFLYSKTISADVGNEMLLAYIVLIDAHRCCTPDITVVGLYDIAYHFVCQIIAIRETSCLSVTRVITEQALVCANKDVALAGFTKRKAYHTIQKIVPAIGTETGAVGDIARDTRYCCQPDTSFSVGHHGRHPVVT